MRRSGQIILTILALLAAPIALLLSCLLTLWMHVRNRKGVVIGLVISNRWVDHLHYTRLPFVFALARTGAKVIAITPRDYKKIKSILERVDGLALTGGEDLHPSYHDGDKALLSKVNEPRDKLEMKILDIADKVGIPYLCVCRGSQLMAIRAGGDISSHHYNDKRIEKHISTLLRFASHQVKLTPGSRIAGIFKEKQIKVNSFHHLLINNAGSDITSGMTSEVVEALEKPGDNFAIGVQWHPEFMAPFDRSQQGLFSALTQHCAALRQ